MLRKSPVVVTAFAVKKFVSRELIYSEYLARPQAWPLMPALCVAGVAFWLSAHLL
jgi:hypothetical protein